MARSARQIEKLSEQIAALSERQKVQLLDRLLTPEAQLALVAERVRRRTRGIDPRRIERDIQAAIRGVRRERRPRGRSA